MHAKVLPLEKSLCIAGDLHTLITLHSYVQPCWIISLDNVLCVDTSPRRTTKMCPTNKQSEIQWQISTVVLLTFKRWFCNTNHTKFTPIYSSTQFGDIQIEKPSILCGSVGLKIQLLTSLAINNTSSILKMHTCNIPWDIWE